MANQTTRDSAKTVALVFVDMYYRVLQHFIDQTHRFYKEESVISWPLPNGEIKFVKTVEEINEFIVSYDPFKDKKVEVTTIDSQPSVAGGVLVMVTACLIGQDNSRKRFSQTFFLAPQETGYYVSNDMFRFVSVEESSAVVEEKVDENVSVAPLATHESKVEDIVEEVSDKSETKVTTDDRVGQKPSLTASKKEKSVAETAPVVQNEAPKISYASMIKYGRSSPPTNVQAPTSTLSGVSRATAPSVNVAQDSIYDDIQYKSVYIGGLPANTTRNDLYAIVKEFGPVHFHDVQIKIYEDGYCVGFVHFQDEVSAQNAVEAHHVIVKGREVYIKYKRLDKGRGERSNSPSGRGGYRKWF